MSLPDQPHFKGVVAAFAEIDQQRDAAEQFAREGWPWEIFAPFSDEEVSRALLPDSRTVHNKVRLWTLLGGFTGGVAAFSMTIWMSMNWPLVVGGKPTVSWPPFIDICFEMSVLIGSLLCMTGMFLRAGLPRLMLPCAYQPEFLHDRFGLWLECDPLQAAELVPRLRAAGAVDVWYAADPGRGRLEIAPQVLPLNI